jgi:hypothetical protein
MKSQGAAMTRKNGDGKKDKVLDLNTKILISIRDATGPRNKALGCAF